MEFIHRSSYREAIDLRTCCAHDDVQFFVFPINGLDSTSRTSLDDGWNEVNLTSIVREFYSSQERRSISYVVFA